MSNAIKNRIDITTISSVVKAASYAVRGPIVQKSAELASALKVQLKNDSEGITTENRLPFDAIIPCNIGNPHALQQKSISFVRDVLSVVMNPGLKDRASFSSDVIQRANKYLNAIPSVGAYSESQGILPVREEVSEFLRQRDGYESNPSDIFLTNGASEGVRFCMQLLFRDKSSGFRDGILAPIPQYPLYSATTTLLQGELVPYYLNESKGWGCNIETLSQALKTAREEGTTVRALVVINPGNPTGQILEEANMRDIVQFCTEEGICLMADEVYQENVWRTGSKFTSFRKVAMDMGMNRSGVDAFGNPGLQMVSFHSISKVRSNSIK